MADCAAMAALPDPPDARTAALEAVSTSNADDEVLLVAFARGDSAAFAPLYQRHRAGLYRYVRRLLGPALTAQVDEVFQDTWLRVVQAAPDYVAQAAGGTARFRTWLFTLAHHRAIDQLRRSGREVALDDDTEQGDEPWQPEGAAWQHWPAANSVPQEDALFWKRAGQRLLLCLDELPAAQRSVFLLHHEEGCALNDIAHSLALGFETTKSRLRYAMARLRLCMGAHLPPAATGGA